MRVAAGVLIATPYVLLPLLWAFELIPAGALLALITAPLAIRFGERASHRSGATLSEILRDAFVLVAAFVGLLLVGLAVPAGAS